MRTGIAVRYSDDLTVKNEIDTILEHNKVFEAQGKVFVGKFGQPIALKHIEACSNGEDYYLILVKKDGPGKYLAHGSKILSIQKKTSR